MENSLENLFIFHISDRRKLLNNFLRSIYAKIGRLQVFNHVDDLDFSGHGDDIEHVFLHHLYLPMNSELMSAMPCLLK